MKMFMESSLTLKPATAPKMHIIMPWYIHQNVIMKILPSFFIKISEFSCSGRKVLIHAQRNKSITLCALDLVHIFELHNELLTGTNLDNLRFIK